MASYYKVTDTQCLEIVTRHNTSRYGNRATITFREMRIVILRKKGLTYREIGDACNCSGTAAANTVKNVNRRVLKYGLDYETVHDLMNVSEQSEFLKLATFLIDHPNKTAGHIIANYATKKERYICDSCAIRGFNKECEICHVQDQLNEIDKLLAKLKLHRWSK